MWWMILCVRKKLTLLLSIVNLWLTNCGKPAHEIKPSRFNYAISMMTQVNKWWLLSKAISSWTDNKNYCSETFGRTCIPSRVDQTDTFENRTQSSDTKPLTSQFNRLNRCGAILWIVFRITELSFEIMISAVASDHNYAIELIRQ